MATKKVVEYTPKGTIKGISVSSSVKLSRDYSPVEFGITMYKEYTEEDNKDINVTKEMEMMFEEINYQIDQQHLDYSEAQK